MHAILFILPPSQIDLSNKNMNTNQNTNTLIQKKEILHQVRLIWAGKYQYQYINRAVDIFSPIKSAMAIMKSIHFPDSLSVTRNTALHGRSFEYFDNQCCITPFNNNNINLTRFLLRDKFVWRGWVLLLANSHKFWYPTLGAIQDLVLQAGATKNPLHQFQTWSHFASQKYQTQVFSQISKSNIPKNIKLKDSQKYQTPKFSEIIKH